ncbi:MAG TPA: sigma 54-interacting transcriptional regulator [Polyangia bacterium]|jgi:DNA-binding NtrC family response regulator/pSer/pThr/pTyr-binding forkhead associated (FHA) protein
MTDKRRAVAGDAQTVTSTASTSNRADRPLLALHVSGPGPGRRHLLPAGLVTLGRSPDATIVIDDARASRSHAVLEIGGDITVTDLGSANGTSIGNRRLAPRQPERLDLGQAFFIGDSALVVRATSLRPDSPNRLTTIQELEERLDALGVPRDPPLAVVEVRFTRPTHRELLDAVLATVLSEHGDWWLWSGRGRLLAGRGAGATDAARGGRALSSELSSWGIGADVEATTLSRGRIPSGRHEDEIGELVTAETRMELSRGTMVMRDPAMLALKQTLARVAPAAVNVLILGETGSGKDVVASMLHGLSPRSKQPLLSINCAALPATLLESELCGYERGAFTGAATSKPGLLEVAHGGTVFLDEIGDMPFDLQAKLLRIIESREVTRLGATRPRDVDVRFVSATNRDLAAEIRAGRFREDLYYRLNTITVTVPRLRDRPADVHPLARFFLESACARFGTGPLDLSPAALAALIDHHWPGNVRELRNAVERAALMASGGAIEPSDLGLSPASTRAGGPESAPAEQMHPPSPVRVAADASTEERRRIEQALQANAWNQSRAAKTLGMPRRTLVRKIARFGFPRPRAS